MKQKLKMGMKRGVKRIAACAVCMAMLVSSLLVASAATNACSHPYLALKSQTFISAEYVNEARHKATYSETRYCTACKAVFDGVRSEEETHFMGSYTDAGHSGVDSHTYRAHCSRCSFSQLIAIYCPGGSSHARP